jgi:DNA-binding transcriptional MocR family regulator
MLAQRGIPLIEDVIFNDLLATDARRKAAKAFDADGGVMVCGSFTKTLAPGVRLGWVDAGRWRDRVATLKRVHGDSTNIVLEHALADLLTQGGYEARLRRLSDSMRLRLAEARRLIAASFPRGTRVSNPPAGYTLWIELPPDVDSMQLHRLCTAQGIAFGPGALFTATDRFGSCLRLSFAGIWGERERQALCQVGRMATQMRQHAIHAQAGNDEDGVAVGGSAARSQAMLPLAAVA